jgi:hypothetical protein
VHVVLYHIINGISFLAACLILMCNVYCIRYVSVHPVCSILAALKSGCCLFRNCLTDGDKPLIRLGRVFQAQWFGVLPKVVLRIDTRGMFEIGIVSILSLGEFCRHALKQLLD